MNEKSYRQEIYTHYLGLEIIPETFIQSLNREQISRQFQTWWGDVLPEDMAAPILDLGCGWGGFLDFLQTKGYTNLAGVDNSKQQVEIAHHFNLKNVEVGDVFNTLSGQRDYYACISAFNLLEHLDKEQVLPFLKEVSAALKPGGRLLLEIPNANSLFGSRTRYWDFTHELSFTPTSIIQILQVTGYTDVQLKERRPVVHGLKSSVRYIFWQIIRQALSLYLIVEQGSPGHQVFTQDMHVIAVKQG